MTDTAGITRLHWAKKIRTSECSNVYMALHAIWCGCVRSGDLPLLTTFQTDRSTSSHALSDRIAEHVCRHTLIAASKLLLLYPAAGGSCQCVGQACAELRKGIHACCGSTTLIRARARPGLPRAAKTAPRACTHLSVRWQILAVIFHLVCDNWLLMSNT